MRGRPEARSAASGRAASSAAALAPRFSPPNSTLSLSSSSPTSARRAIRCAIYTRKSTDEGLEQDFNSLDAQREAAEAYIASQKEEGWTVIPTLYDDGGYSGGTMERPALKRLLADIEAGAIYCLVVYKVDRLSRSLPTSPRSSGSSTPTSVTAPRFMIRDRGGAFGPAFSARVRGLGVKELRTGFRATTKNAHAERMIETCRRKCFDHVIVWNEAHTRHLLRELVAWYSHDRTHLALGKDSPDGRPIESPELGKIVAFPRLGGLHNRYLRGPARR